MGRRCARPVASGSCASSGSSRSPRWRTSTGTSSSPSSRDQLDDDPEVSRKKYELFSKTVDRWDFLGVEGEMYHTDKGELTIKVRNWIFLGKTLQSAAEQVPGRQRHRS